MSFFDWTSVKPDWTNNDPVALTKLQAMENAISAILDRNISLDGWVETGLTGSYIDSTSFSLEGDMTAYISKGTKIKFTQATDGVKYLYVVGTSYNSGTDTSTFTIAENTDYDLDNEDLTSFYYSNEATPSGFPYWFNFTPVLTADGSMTVSSSSVSVGKFRINGLSCEAHIRITATLGGSASGGLLTTTPVDRGVTAESTFVAGFGLMRQAGTEYAAKVSWNSTNASSIRIKRYDDANYGLGADGGINIIAVYSI